jgi:hypothetical protein
MFPAIPAPSDGQVRIPIEVKLKPGWYYNAAQRAFVSDSGETIKPAGLPRKSKIVTKVPPASGKKKLSMAEQDLQRYLQVILPPDESAADHVKTVKSWACIADARTGPEISLP